jgi:hypothetical protein
MDFWPVKPSKTLKRGSGEKCSLSCNSFNHTDIGSWFIEAIIEPRERTLERVRNFLLMAKTVHF